MLKKVAWYLLPRKLRFLSCILAIRVRQTVCSYYLLNIVTGLCYRLAQKNYVSGVGILIQMHCPQWLMGVLLSAVAQACDPRCLGGWGRKTTWTQALARRGCVDQWSQHSRGLSSKHQSVLRLHRQLEVSLHYSSETLAQKQKKSEFGAILRKVLWSVGGKEGGGKVFILTSQWLFLKS